MIAVVRRVNPLEPVLEDKKPKPNYARGSVEWQEEQKMAKILMRRRRKPISNNTEYDKSKRKVKLLRPGTRGPAPTSYVRG
jgi:hypothetical protein